MPIKRLPGGEALEERLAAYSERVASGTRFRNRLGHWTMYGVAGAAALAGTTSASASIIYSGPVNLTLQLGTSSRASTALQIPGLKATLNFGLFHLGGTGISGGAVFEEAGAFFGVKYGNVIFGQSSSVKRFAFRDLISHSMAGGNLGPLFQHLEEGGGILSSTRGDWFGPQATGYAGLSLLTGTHRTGPFSSQVVANTGRFLGWAHLQVNSLDGFPDSITLLNYGYDNNATDASIVAGAPEPKTASMLLLAAGAAGVLAWKRQRKTMQRERKIIA